MTKNDLLQHYFKERAEADQRRGGYPFVTISREAGAGGHQLAEEIIAQLNRKSYSDLFRGWQLFDQKICDFVMNDPELAVSLESLLVEEYHSEIQDLMDELFGRATSQLKVYKKTFEIVRMLAQVGKVVMVGRAANCLTRTMRGGIHVRLVADENVRIARMGSMLELDKQEATKIVHQQDKQRAKLVYDFFNEDINDGTLYDVTWNTTKISLKEIAASIVTRIDYVGHGALEVQRS